MRLVGLAAAAVLCCACSDQTAILLVVDGDLAPGVDFDGLDLSMRREGAEVWSDREALTASDSLPRTVRIRPSSPDDDAVELALAATLDHRPVVEAVREAAFSRGDEVTVRVCLWRRCQGSSTADCRAGRCEPVGGDGDGDADVADAEGDAEGDADGDEPLCDDSCPHARDGRCEDGGEGSAARWCDYGTDCGDCGERAAGGCVPDCTLRQCGSDGCGGTCGPGCAEGEGCAPGGACVRWIRVAAAGFLMGAPEDEVGFMTRVETQHEVVLTRDFLLAAREVSQAWLTAVTGHNPTTFELCDDCPADSVRWHAAALFCNYLSRAEGLEPCFECRGSWPDPVCEPNPALTSPYECEGYRLPTEAEWELAARGGTTSATYNGDLDADHLECESPNDVLDPIAWFCGNAPDGAPRPRALLEPNPLELFDILGNAGEHAFDAFDLFSAEPAVDPWGPPEGSTHVVRGGSTLLQAVSVRAAGRVSMSAATATPAVGFRPARTAP